MTNNTIPIMSPDISLAPIDCGFDPRAHDMVCAVPADAKCVRYQVRDSYQVRDAVGSLDEIAAELRLNGYSIRIEK